MSTAIDTVETDEGSGVLTRAVAGAVIGGLIGLVIGGPGGAAYGAVKGATCSTCGGGI